MGRVVLCIGDKIETGIPDIDGTVVSFAPVGVPLTEGQLIKGGLEYSDNLFKFLLGVELPFCGVFISLESPKGVSILVPAEALAIVLSTMCPGRHKEVNFENS
jgi:hypothetical protein